MNVGKNTLPLVRPSGVLNDMTNAGGFASAINAVSIPGTLVPSNGGFSDIYYFAQGASDTIENVSGGIINVNNIDSENLYIIRFFFTYDSTLGSGGYLYSEPGSFAAYWLNSLGQFLGQFETNQNYIVDNFFLKDCFIFNRSTRHDLAVQLTQLIPF